MRLRTRDEEVARYGQVLVAVTRLRIIRLLRNANLCVTALARRLAVTQGAVSQHLRVLRQAGLARAERRGYFVHYRLSTARLLQYQAWLAAGVGIRRRRGRSGKAAAAARRCKTCVCRERDARSRRRAAAARRRVPRKRSSAATGRRNLTRA